MSSTNVSSLPKPNQRRIAQVKWFNEAKGYGFLDYEGQNVFVHWSHILKDGFKSLIEGESVEFDLILKSTGPDAHNVQVNRLVTAR